MKPGVQVAVIVGPESCCFGRAASNDAAGNYQKKNNHDKKTRFHAFAPKIDNLNGNYNSALYKIVGALLSKKDIFIGLSVRNQLEFLPGYSCPLKIEKYILGRNGGTHYV